MPDDQWSPADEDNVGGVDFTDDLDVLGSVATQFLEGLRKLAEQWDRSEDRDVTDLASGLLSGRYWLVLSPDGLRLLNTEGG